jgi:hypothetical protein
MEKKSLDTHGEKHGKPVIKAMRISGEEGKRSSSGGQLGRVCRGVEELPSALEGI